MVHFGDDVGNPPDIGHGIGGGMLDGIDLFTDNTRGFGRLPGQGLDLIGHHGKSLTGVSGPGRLDRGVQGQ